MRVARTFFTQPTLVVAEQLLGKVLVYESPKGRFSGVITEVEAYSQEESACHAYLGRQTKRNAPMYLDGGHLYVYFIYGMHHCINVVTEGAGKGCAVLIRAVQPLENLEGKNLSGPGNVAKAFGFNLTHSGLDSVSVNAPIWIEDRGYQAKNIQWTPRIGISKAIDLPWRAVCELVI